MGRRKFGPYSSTGFVSAWCLGGTGARGWRSRLCDGRVAGRLMVACAVVDDEDTGNAENEPNPDDLPEQADTGELTMAQLWTLNNFDASVQNMSKEECKTMIIEVMKQMMAKENLIKSMFKADDDISFGPTEVNLQELFSKKPPNEEEEAEEKN